MGRKASFLPRPDQTSKPIYLAVNADESEPGTFKDREIMFRIPHALIEGVVDSELRDRGARRRSSTSAASTWPSSRSSVTRSRKRTAVAASSARTSSALGSTSRSSSTAALAPTSAARRPGCSSRSRASAVSPVRSRRSRRSRASTARQRLINNVETLATLPIDSAHRRRGVREDRCRELGRYAPLLAFRQRGQRRQLRARARHAAAYADLRCRRRNPGRSEAEGGHSRAAHRFQCSRPRR